MQFVPYGPDVPDALLQAHEEGRVVFFCGAGISYAAGLPSFEGLVDQIFAAVGTGKAKGEKSLMDRSEYDQTLHRLERRVTGQRFEVRRHLLEILKPDLNRPGATDAHAALLRLSRDREGSLRLVTTNFDRIFDAAAQRIEQEFETFAAPRLPIPKDSRWNGLVYLHGRLPEQCDQTALNELVLTSGDFGIAYLFERWAARFVCELLRNYVLCFVGYSLNDPVLRYILDAMAADQILGESGSQAWAFGSYRDGKLKDETDEWEAKNVTPIMYEVQEGDHSALGDTLQKWAETYRDGITGKERIVEEHAAARPSASTQQDYFVGRMLWAISDKTGLPAKRFAGFNPAPPLEWLLDVFSERKFGHPDLERSAVLPSATRAKAVQFTLIDRPPEYGRSPHMQLASGQPKDTDWDPVMTQLGHWLTRHLDDPRLVLWIARRGGRLHDDWARMVEQRLEELHQLERDGTQQKLDEIRQHAPNAVPCTPMRVLWQQVLGERLKSFPLNFSLYRWKDRVERDGLTATHRQEFRRALAPTVVLSERARWYDAKVADISAPPESVRDLFDLEIAPSDDHAGSALEMVTEGRLQTVLPALLEDLERVLRDTLDLMNDLGMADSAQDRSHFDLPSIAEHWQNRGLREWVLLIRLLRDAWLAVVLTDAPLATRIAQEWFALPYPTFKRLALFAASHNGIIAPSRWTNWLTTDRRRWLWAVDTRREMFRLLVQQGPQLSPSMQTRLEQAIVAGPPRAMFRDDLDPDRWCGIVDREIWLRLAKLESSGLRLTELGGQRLRWLSDQHPTWCLQPHERDEFAFWSSGTGDPDYEARRETILAPKALQELADWLKVPVDPNDFYYEDDWRDICRDRLSLSIDALSLLAREDVWPIERWREALQVWRDDQIVQLSWRSAASLVLTMPDAELYAVEHALTSWLEAVSKGIDQHEPTLFGLCDRVFRHAREDARQVAKGDVSGSHPVGSAINHPIGHVTDALLNIWSARKLGDNQRIDSDIESFLTELCDDHVPEFRHGRVVLASQLILLFRVDRAWTEHNLLPRFNWKVDATEAKAMWEGFLWSPRIYVPLMIAFKKSFLDTATRYYSLGKHAEQYAALLTYSALNRIDGYTTEEWREAFECLPVEGLERAARSLARSLDSAGEQRGANWRNRVQPFWKDVWPKSGDRVTPQIGEHLARMTLAAGDEFPSALEAVRDWIKPMEHPYFLTHLLAKSEICSRHPEGALLFLDLIVDERSLVVDELEKCLNDIQTAERTLVEQPRYQSLQELSRR